MSLKLRMISFGESGQSRKKLCRIMGWHPCDYLDPRNGHNRDRETANFFTSTPWLALILDFCIYSFEFFRH